MKQQQPQSIQTTYTYACTHMHRLIPIPMITYTCKQTYMLTYPIISNHNLITIKPTHAKVCTSYMIVYPQYKYQTPRCEVTRAPLPLEDLPPLPQVVSDPSHNQWLPMVLLILALGLGPFCSSGKDFQHIQCSACSVESWWNLQWLIILCDWDP